MGWKIVPWVISSLLCDQNELKASTMKSGIKHGMAGRLVQANSGMASFFFQIGGGIAGDFICVVPMVPGPGMA